MNAEDLTQITSDSLRALQAWLRRCNGPTLDQYRILLELEDQPQLPEEFGMLDREALLSRGLVSIDLRDDLGAFLTITQSGTDLLAACKAFSEVWLKDQARHPQPYSNANT